MKKYILFNVIFLLSVFAYSHGFEITITQQSPFIIVKSNYPNGTPLEGAIIKVIKSRKENDAFLKGRIDSQGNFMFKPDSSGEWEVYIDDGLGHKKKASILIEDFFFNKQLDRKSNQSSLHLTKKKVFSIPFVIKLMIGLSLIFGLTGLVYGLKAGKKKKKNEA